MDALLIVDMLKDFIEPGAPLEVPQASDIVPNIKREIAKARACGAPVIYINDAHRDDDPEFCVWPRHAVRGTDGAKVVEEIAPLEGDPVIEKTSYSGFFGTDLEARLRTLGAKKLTITGVVTNICILYTAADALMRGFEVEIPEDCVAALNDEDHRFALKQIKSVLKPRQV
ncbi:MAG: isochorismatase family protein [Candidatus Latescibacteria bacterium]|nr:isochorismatase family protein [Candidatus Latescibacterota bacterium]NIM21403.1 isochorismatase family protein [Candidatus Latescibacterota bacterium]NIM65584.1 isochorismatase family protein [Candidatus Latescibacterota bacterium]NIO01964.1 isochorismatase family protein [Candidatus Latescibacterota bacterium]NIO28777.1 isochorismatase family protein [Candidatus Latescibacterota bacterium]